jgi:hypothetical protein
MAGVLPCATTSFQPACADSGLLGKCCRSTPATSAKWIAAAIGGGLTYAAVSNTCAMATVLSKLPYNRGAQADAETLVSQLKSAAAGQ